MTAPLMHPLIARTMFAEGFLPFHAAALERNGETILLSGEKGAGKSTLAIKLHQLGFQPLCDDLVYLREDHPRLVAGGHCQPIKIKTDEAGSLLKSGLATQAGFRILGKTLFPVQQFNAEGVNRLYPVSSMIFLDNTTPGETKAAVVAGQEVEVLRHLLGTGLVVNTPASRVRAFELICGAGGCHFLLARTSANSEITAGEIVRALDHA